MLFLDKSARRLVQNGKKVGHDKNARNQINERIINERIHQRAPKCAPNNVAIAMTHLPSTRRFCTPQKVCTPIDWMCTSFMWSTCSRLNVMKMGLSVSGLRELPITSTWTFGSNSLTGIFRSPPIQFGTRPKWSETGKKVANWVERTAARIHSITNTYGTWFVVDPHYRYCMHTHRGIMTYNMKIVISIELNTTSALFCAGRHEKKRWRKTKKNSIFHWIACQLDNNCFYHFIGASR